MPKSQPLLPDPNPKYAAPQQGYGMYSQFYSSDQTFWITSMNAAVHMCPQTDALHLLVKQ